MSTRPKARQETPASLSPHKPCLGHKRGGQRPLAAHSGRTARFNGVSSTQEPRVRMRPCSLTLWWQAWRQRRRHRQRRPTRCGACSVLHSTPACRRLAPWTMQQWPAQSTARRGSREWWHTPPAALLRAGKQLHDAPRAAACPLSPVPSRHPLPPASPIMAPLHLTLPPPGGAAPRRYAPPAAGVPSHRAVQGPGRPRARGR